MPAPELDELIRLLARLPGLGPRSAKRAALAMLKRPETLLRPIAVALAKAGERVGACSICGNLDVVDPCAICADPSRDSRLLCVVQDVEDLWAMERAASYRGRYHVLGGLLSALDGVGPEDLDMPKLARRIEAERIEEVVLGLGVTVDGQTTAHYLASVLAPSGARLTRLAQGLPIGGELNFLDEGTLDAAFRARAAFDAPNER